MNVTFHALAAVGIAHVAAIRMDSSREGRFYRSDVAVLASAVALGVLSHGVLDGLKHGYPIQTVPDVLCAAVLAIGWCLCVHRRFVLLFASVCLASFAPDIVDLGPRMLHSEAAGVRRISLAGSLYRAATSGLVAAARELKDKGTFGYVDTSLPSAEVAGFMRG